MYSLWITKSIYVIFHIVLKYFLHYLFTTHWLCHMVPIMIMIYILYIQRVSNFLGAIYSYFWLLLDVYTRAFGK